MNKRGQFYIVAAIIIVLAIAGLSSYGSYTLINSKPQTISTLGNELNEEGARIIDYGVYNGEEVQTLIESFTEDEFADYFLRKTDQTNVVFLYGNKTDLKSLQFSTQSTGKISAVIGGGTTNWNFDGIFINQTEVDILGDKVNVTILNTNYTFEIKDNELFYFVIVKEDENGIYIEKND